MVTLTYLHNHECSQKGEELIVHPTMRGGAYRNEVWLCAETKAELLLVGEGERV